MNFLTTNATGTADNPKTYTWVAESSAESGESVPSGLAATILAERSGPLLSERMSIRLGDALPQLGDAIVESEGTVFLQSFDVDCAALVADLHFGVPDYLSPEDMASLLSGFRNKCTSASASIRKTGKTKDGGTNVEMGSIPPLSSTEFAPGKKAKMTIKSSGSSGGGISLDSSELDSGETISVKTLTIKGAGEDGEDKTYKVLATEDMSIEGDPSDKVVTSLNEGTGDMDVIGGKGIVVETNGKTIKITADPDKTDEDEDPNAEDPDPCDHDKGGGSAGGVSPSLEDGGASGVAGGVPAGGVPAGGGDKHTGDDDCNCN